MGEVQTTSDAILPGAGETCIDDRRAKIGKATGVTEPKP